MTRTPIPGARSAAAAALAAVALLGVATAAAPDLLSLRVRRGAASPVPLGDVIGGRATIVTFWSASCPPCRAEVPVMQHAARRWGASGVRVVGVGTGFDDATHLARVVREWGIDYETAWVAGGEDDLLERLLPRGLPVTFFVGPDGIRREDRMLSEAEIDELVTRELHVAPSADRGEHGRSGHGNHPAASIY